MSRRRFDLSGIWERWVRGKRWDMVNVPSSLRPSGAYTLQRSVPLPAIPSGERLFLHFEGIAYYAAARMNGREAGECGPYVPVDLEITDKVREGDNLLQVAIWDLESGDNSKARAAAFIGVNPGWEAYGGIIRDTWVETRPASYIENARLSYSLPDDFSRAEGELEVYLSAAAPTVGDLTVEVFHGSNRITNATMPVQLRAGSSQAAIKLVVEQPLLWSPEQPHLYRVVVTLRTNQGSDSYSFRTGFRHLRIQGRRIEWNGKAIVLQGFCRHDMWKEQGFTLTADQQRSDMQAIKQTDANFVRLAHYPHDRRVVDLADELGLFVTEEPGYWQVDFEKLSPSVIGTGLATLDATIRRDWNSPSVFGWFLGNESELTTEYLRAGKELCHRLDPLRRPVSFANHLEPAKIRPMFEETGLDFFSQHLYTFNSNKFDETAELYGDAKPLFIDEWGWEDAGRGQIFWERNFDHLLSAVRTGKVAGHAFWSWNDMRQYARIDWPTYDGTLFSGVVTESREPRPDLYDRFVKLFQNREEHPGSSRIGLPLPVQSAPDITPLRVAVTRSRVDGKTVSLQEVVESNAAQAAWQDLEDQMREFWAKSRMAKNQWERTNNRLLFWEQSLIEIAGVPFQCAARNGFVRPVIVTPKHPEISIPVGRHCEELYLLGNVTFPNGYPLTGKRGDVAAVAELRLAGGHIARTVLRNGVEVARSNIVYDATRIEPIASAAPRALLFQKDPAREQYQVLLFSFPANGHVMDFRLRLQSGPPLAIFAVTASSGKRNA